MSTPTIRYWRHDRGHQVITETELMLNSPERRKRYVEVVVMTPAELEAHTAAARAEGWDEGWHEFEPDAPNPYLSTESED